MRVLLAIGVLGAILSACGCQTLTDGVSRIAYELQPHRLWRLNRQPPPSRDAYFCIPETVPGGGDQSARSMGPGGVSTQSFQLR